MYTRLMFSVPIALGLVGCSMIERTEAPPRSSRATGTAIVPQILRGTVASETLLDGNLSVVAHGYGLVVGLNGTGSSDVPPNVRAHMISLASRHGIGSARTGWRSLTPEALLDSPDTAVVIVEGVIPPAAPKGSRFDVRIFPHPSTATTSLEGGRLYTTELVPVMRPNVGRRMLPPSGGQQPAALAEASGPLFINPFADPDAVGRDIVDRRYGMILNGGTVLNGMPLKLRLITPSHARASMIQNAINTRFIQEPAQRDPTARGENDETIAITVPPSYYDNTADFVELIRHTTIRQTGTGRVAMTIRRFVTENPATAIAASWRWQALGPNALPVIRELYDAPQEKPRLAALRAGANLDDPLVISHLISMATGGSAHARLQSISLLARMGIDPRIDYTLRALLNEPDMETRLAAYEALADRRDPAVRRIAVGNKYVLDIVDSQVSMVYVTQLGMPRIAVFDPTLTIKRPVTVTAWSKRFMLKGDLADDDVELYYRPLGAQRGWTQQVSPRMAELLEFLGRTTAVDNPVPGLDFSYSQVVGIVHQIWRQGYLEADFRPEQDRILAAIIRLQRRGDTTERPEFDLDLSPSAEELPDPRAGEDAFLLPAEISPGP